MKSPSSGLSGRAASAGVLRRAGGLRYLLLARFSQDIAAPLPASLPVDVGGPLTVVQNDGQLSQSGGKLVFPAQATPTWGDQGFYTSVAFNRAAGRALFWEIIKTSATTSNGPTIGWSGTQVASYTGLTTPGIYFTNGANITIHNQGGAEINVGTYGISTAYQVLIVLRTTGAFYCIKGGAFTNWTLLWVDTSSTTASLYPALANYNAVGTLDNFRVLDLPQFATDAQVYTNRLVSPAAGATTTSTADAVIEWTFVASNTVNCTINVRYTDNDNRWRIKCGNDLALNLFEHKAGVLTGRANVLGSFVNGQTYRMVLVVEGGTYKIYQDNVLKASYTDPASFNASVTTVQAAEIASGISSLTCWPRTLTLPSGV